MESWMVVFVGVLALCILVQTLVLIGMFVMFQNVAKKAQQQAEEFRNRVVPVLSGLQQVIEEVRPHVTNVVANAAEVTNVARMQAQRVDRVMSEAMERLRIQLAHIDQILTGTLETVEEAGSKFRRTVWSPVQSVAAVVRGIQTGLEFYRGSRRRPYEVTPDRSEQPDENLFI